MGFPIPEPFCWDESFKVFYDKLDEQHKQLFKGLYDVNKDPGNANKVRELKDSVIEHFNTEEKLMQKCKYEDYVTHKTYHDDFVEKLGGLTLPVPEDAIKWAKSWLVNHIKEVDFKYKGKL